MKCFFYKLNCCTTSIKSTSTPNREFRKYTSSLAADTTRLYPLQTWRRVVSLHFVHFFTTSVIGFIDFSFYPFSQIPKLRRHSPGEGKFSQNTKERTILSFLWVHRALSHDCSSSTPHFRNPAFLDGFSMVRAASAVLYSPYRFLLLLVGVYSLARVLKLRSLSVESGPRDFSSIPVMRCRA